MAFATGGIFQISRRNLTVHPYGEDNYFLDYEFGEGGDNYIESSQVPHDAEGLCANAGDIINDLFEKMCSTLQDASIALEDEFSYFRKSLGVADGYSEPIDHKFADIIKTLFDLKTSRDGDKLNEESIKSYHKPENCDVLNVPELNKILWDNISGNAWNVDKALQKIATGVVKSMKAVSHALDILFWKKSELDKQTFIDTRKCLGDGLGFLGATNSELVHRHKEAL